MKKVLVIAVMACAGITLAGCKKKATAQPEKVHERISGTHAAVDIVWEENDLK